jgi:hypothetical protein
VQLARRAHMIIGVVICEFVAKYQTLHLKNSTPTRALRTSRELHRSGISMKHSYKSVLLTGSSKQFRLRAPGL